MLRPLTACGLVALLATPCAVRADLAAGAFKAPVSGAIGAQAPPSGQRGESLADARAALAEGRTDDAIALARRLLEKGAGIVDVAPILGEAYRRTDRFALALRFYADWLQAVPDSSAALQGLAAVRHGAGDYDGAAAAYEQMLGREPDRALTYRQAAAVEIARGRHAEVIRLLGEYLKRAPADPETLNTLGIAHSWLDQRDEAIAAFEAALALDPEHVPAHLGLGVALAERPAGGERALEHLRRAAAALPDNADIAYRLGRLLAELERPEEALRELRRSLVLNPERADAHYRMTLLLTRLGDRAAARASMQRFSELKQAEEAMEGARAQRQALTNDAQEALAAGDVGRAASLLSVALERYPDDPRGHVIAARVWMARSEPMRVLEATEAALRLEADNPDALYLRGLALLALDRPPEAREVLERLLAAYPMIAGAHAALGNALMALGETAAALEAYEIARALEPDSAAHYLNLATAYRRLGKTDQEAAMLAEHRRLLSETSR